MNHGEKAKALFESGCNCAQSVFTAFCDVTGMEEKAALRLSSSFGGGIGRMREVCGAVSGACMVLGCVYGYDEIGNDQIKKEHYSRIQSFCRDFQAEHGSILCRELLEKPSTDATPCPRTPEYYAERPCAWFVLRAAEWVDAYLEAHPL